MIVKAREGRSMRESPENSLLFQMHFNENKIKRHINKSLDPKVVVLIICY